MSRSTIHDSLRLELMDDVPVARLLSTQRVFDRAVERVAEFIRETVAKGHPHLLLDVRDAAFRSPSVVDRMRMARLWADAADSRLRIVVVARPEFIDPERFGVVVAANFGLTVQVFECQEDAIAWLRAECAAELERRGRPVGEAPRGE
jgi:hypothetical protein